MKSPFRFGRKQWISAPLLFVAALAQAADSNEAGKSRVDCTPAREYVTTLEYLRDVKELAIKEDDARKVAEKVSTGCSGAAKRFIRVTETLSKAGLGANNMIETATDLATRTDRETDTFLTVFRKAFLPEYLDLDVRDSLRLAQSLTTEFKGDFKAVRKDFETVLEYCLSEKELDLSKPQCGDLAVKVARIGERYDGGASKPFIEALEFARSSKGPGLPVQQAVELALGVSGYGPKAHENFAQAYQYAVSQSGLNLGADKAMAFAKGLATKSSKTE